MPKVTVIIPNYNHARYLNQRINSVLNQTYQNFEVIILDDCSNDNSRNVIEEYRTHPKVNEIVFNETNSGSTFKQWDKGIALAKGDYIWIAESDDYADASFLETLIGIVDREAEIGLVYCGSNIVDENGSGIGEIVRDVKINRNGYYYNNGYDECLDYAFFTPVVPNASAVLFKKENFYKVDPRYKQYKICGDWQFWIDICFDNHVAYLPVCLNYFRQSNTSVSRSTHYRKDNLTVFALEKLKIALYVYEKTNNIIPLSTKLKYIQVYLFEILLESSRKRIFLSTSNIKFISSSLFHLSFLAPVVFFKSLAKVSFRALGMVKRKIVNVNLKSL